MRTRIPHARRIVRALLPFAAVLGIALGILAGGCAADSTDADDGRMRVVATTSMIADLVAVVGGDAVTVTGLMGPGIDPHLYKASEGDVARMSRADVIFYHGLDLEGKMADVLERMDGRKRTVAVTANLDRNRLIAPPEYSGNYDPHVWFDVGMWREVAATVRDRLVEIDPDNADAYRANATVYLAELDSLDAYVRAQAERVPAEQRVLVTAHDAFNYFGRAYGFEVRGLQGISTASEAGTADVQQLAAFVAERRIPAMFVESSVPPRSIEAVRAAVRDRGFEVEIGGNLYSDALGSPGTPEGTYLGTVRHNIDTIVEALTIYD